MSLLLLLINLFLLLLSLINFFTIRRPISASFNGSSIAILLPVRNEEVNIARVLNELISQEGVPQLKIIVIDDHSEDATLEIARRFADSQVTIIQAAQLSEGWLGKVNALQSGFAEVGSADVVISIDADVHFEQDAIVRAVSTLQSLHLDFISPYPRQIALTWAERIAQPLLQWSWMSTVLLRGAEKFPRPSTVICNGQFLVMRGEALRRINGFESVAYKVLDDLELGREFISAGYKGVVIDGSEIASTRMYSNFEQLRAGYAKSLHTAFGPLIGSLYVGLFILVTGVLPLALALTGNPLAIIALAAIVGTRIISAIAASTKVGDSFLHPLSALFFSYLLYYSWRHRRHALWKGRTV